MRGTAPRNAESCLLLAFWDEKTDQISMLGVLVRNDDRQIISLVVIRMGYKCFEDGDFCGAGRSGRYQKTQVPCQDCPMWWITDPRRMTFLVFARSAMF